MNKNSEQLNELFSALAKAQSTLKSAIKDAKNPFFKSNYATLDACWDACRGPLSAQGLTIVQTLEEDPSRLYLRTILGHSSGQYISSVVPLPLAKQDPQSLGSVISYMRRYCLCAIVGLSQADDDGETAMVAHRGPPPDPMKEFCFSLNQTYEGEPFSFQEVENYLHHLAGEKGVAPNKIIEQASKPDLMKRFIKGFDEWRKK